jgi:hypothetical protein
MVSLQQTDGMFQAGSVGRKLTASKGGSVLRKLAWQGFLIGLVLINPSGRMGSMHLPAALSPESLVLPLDSAGCRASNAGWENDGGLGRGIPGLLWRIGGWDGGVGGVSAAKFSPPAQTR